MINNQKVDLPVLVWSNRRQCSVSRVVGCRVVSRKGGCSGSDVEDVMAVMLWICSGYDVDMMWWI